MSIQNINIEGTATFNDTSSNFGEIVNGVFAGSSTNEGSVTVAATFQGSATNVGTVEVAVFTGSAVNTGTVVQAEFRDTASNAGTVTLSAAFADSAVNSGTIQGDAIFADTTTNSGTVQGDAQVAATASNSGTVAGTVTEYVPPIEGHWYDTETGGTVTNYGATLVDEGGGVKAASVTGGYLDTGVAGNFSGDFTVELFLKPNQLGNFFIGNANSGGNDSWALGIGNSRELALTSQAAGYAATAQGLITYEQWNHVVFMRSSGTTVSYINGILVKTYESTPTFASTETIKINIPGYLIQGKIAGVRVSNVARYSGYSITIPTSVFTSDADTRLLMNFGATAVPTASFVPPYIWDAEFGTNCSTRGTGPHQDMGTMTSTISIGTQMFEPQNGPNGGPWIQSTGSGSFIINDHQYTVSGGVISNIESCTGY